VDAMSDAEEDLTNGSGGVYKKVVQAGISGGSSGLTRPPHGANVTVHYEGFLLNGQKFDSSKDRDEPFTFKLGVGQVIEGWDLAVASMVPSEVAIFTCRADYAYGWEGKPPKIPVDATLRFEVELLSWEPSKKTVGEMTPAEKLEHGRRKRENGTAKLKDGEHFLAAAEFSEAVEALSALHVAMTTSSVAPDAERLEEVASALRSCLLNHSQCCLKLEIWEGTAACCTKVLRLDGRNVKAYFRRGVALTALEKYDDALADLRMACQLDARSKEVREAFDKAKAALTAHKQAEKSAFGGMFGSGGDS